MNIKNKIIFTSLLGLLSTSIFMAGCAHDEPSDPVALSEPAKVIVGEGSGVYAAISMIYRIIFIRLNFRHHMKTSKYAFNHASCGFVK